MCTVTRRACSLAFCLKSAAASFWSMSAAICDARDCERRARDVRRRTRREEADAARGGHAPRREDAIYISVRDTPREMFTHWNARCRCDAIDWAGDDGRLEAAARRLARSLAHLEGRAGDVVAATRVVRCLLAEVGLPRMGAG